MSMDSIGYYFITDENLSRRGVASDVAEACQAGVSMVQYLNKTGSTRKLFEEAMKLRLICEEHGVFFIVNDRVDVALAVNADGVHLGQDDMPLSVARELLGNDKIIGVTVHNVKEAIEAELGGADYLGVSPIFNTKTKKDAGEAGSIELLERVKQSCRIPLVGIGGINLDNAQRVIKAGASGVCAISAVVTKDNVKAEIEKFVALFRK